MKINFFKTKFSTEKSSPVSLLANPFRSGWVEAHAHLCRLCVNPQGERTKGISHLHGSVPTVVTSQRLRKGLGPRSESAAFIG